MSIVPVIAGLAFLCGGFMLFDDLRNEVSYVESAALVKRFEGKEGLSAEAQAAYEEAKAVVDRRKEAIALRAAERSAKTSSATKNFLTALIAGNLNSAILILRLNPAIKKNPMLAEIIDAALKRDMDALEAALKAVPAGPAPS